MPTFGHNLTRVMEQVQDSLPRVPCTMHPDDFYRDYIVPSVPVVLTGCAESWAARDWTMNGLYRRYGDDVTWTCQATLRDDSCGMEQKCKITDRIRVALN